MKRLVLGLIGLFGFVAATSAQINSNGQITGLPEGSPTCTAINGPDVRTLTDAQGTKWSFGRNYPNDSSDWEIFNNGIWFGSGGGRIITIFGGIVYMYNGTSWWTPTITSWVSVAAPACNVVAAPAFTGVPQVEPDSPYVPPGYVITFNDEFASLNTISHGPGPSVPGVLWYNGNAQCCIQPSVSGQSGQMYPTPGPGRRAINPFSLDPNGGLDLSLTLSGNMWNSAVPSSLANDGHGFAQQYGYFEMSAQLPADPGTWPSFWMRPVNPASNVGEIDIMEAYTQFQNSYCATLHDWANTANSVGNCPNSVVEVGNPPNPALSTGYHVYAMRWTPTMVSFYFDGQLIWQHPPLHPAMDGPYYLLFDLGIGGGWPTTQTRSPSVMKIKYIRAYRHP
jgi:hypothetical protein